MVQGVGQISHLYESGVLKVEAILWTRAVFYGDASRLFGTRAVFYEDVSRLLYYLSYLLIFSH